MIECRGHAHGTSMTRPLQVMLPRFWVASTKPEAALVRSQGLFSLGKDEGGLWRRVIAGQKRS
jgi:hypothetical protein